MSLPDEAFDRDWKSSTVRFEEAFDAHINRSLVLAIMAGAEAVPRTIRVRVGGLTIPPFTSSVAYGWYGMHRYRMPFWAVNACVLLLDRPETRYLFDLHPDAVATLAGSGNEDALWVLDAMRLLHEGD
ncbi:MAG: hypothetical protein EHM17_11180 [Verrucomicrobiaceae bacterium]|nr:MAG: hypothetical protein EHM17_16340 [Verrucomicrobiaceae bacterium]RPJ33170.1 MAG: hypothetical protein EHM17_11180 [Verrucomicrobiaceae bacterium]